MKRKISAILLVLIMLIMSGCSENSSNNEKSEVSFNDSTLGVVTGSIYDGYSREKYPGAKIDYYNNFADLFQCIKQKKIDGFLYDEAAFSAVQRTDANLQSTSVPEYHVDIGFGYQKNDEGAILQEQMNELLKELENNGSMEKLIEKWYGTEEPTEEVVKPDFSDNKTPLVVAIDTTRKPFVYLINSQPAGLEIEVMYEFCERYGYKPTFSDVPFASGLAGLAIEKYEMVCGGLYMTAERKKSVNFSEPYMSAKVIMVTYNSEENASAFASLKDSFNKTIIQESRWKLIISGMLTTLLITASSVLLGSLLGFAMYMASRSKIKPISYISKILSRICIFLLRGMPTLVFLMLLYYIVFGDSDISGTIVAIIGFTITFSSFVYTSLGRSAELVDKGQIEAAYALGYGYNHTFFRIILPQAIRTFLPVYSEEIVTLVKATSVVGYIAVNDVTKIADIIRSTTFEAFFPLIAATMIYFVITWISTGILRYVIKVTDPKSRKKKKFKKGEAK